MAILQNDPIAAFESHIDRFIGVGALSLAERNGDHLLHLLLLGKSHQIAQRVGPSGEDENERGDVVSVDVNLRVI